MALTAAERSKRYREKNQEDAEKHEQHKKKELKRLQKHQKKIKDLTEEEKAETRKKWRDQKKKQKERKKKRLLPKPHTENNISATGLFPKPASAFLIKKYKRLLSVYKKALKQVEEYKTTASTLRKKLYRAENKLKEQIKSREELQSKTDKLQARQEVMEASLREVYGDCKKNDHKQVLKRVATKMGHRTNQTPDHKLLGLRSQMKTIRKKPIRNKKIRVKLEDYYHRDDISRSTAGRRETRTMKKKKMQIRYLVDTLQNLYQVYKAEGGKYGFTTFFRYKPFYVLSPSVNTRETCMCIRHSDIDFMFNALKLKGVLQYKGTTELLHDLACNVQSYDCMYGKCVECKSRSIQHKEDTLQNDIKWHKWARVDHMYEKSGQGFKTKKTTKQLVEGTVSELLAVFTKEMVEFKKHYFNWKEQQRQYRACVTKMKQEEGVILCDFSENYGCKYGQEVQSTHFGASKSSVTLHCGVIFIKDRSQSFVTVSDNNCHEPHAIWAHMIPVIKHAKEMNPNLKVIHFFSDGPSSQYRQKKNFYLLNLFTQKLNLTYTTWSFSEAGHGKSLADGIGGSVKRQLDKRVSYGEDITSGTEVYQVLQAKMKSVKSFYVCDEDIEDIKKNVPDQLRPVPQTMQLHQVICEQKSQEIHYRQLSCFCDEMRGRCKCHLPKIHIFATSSLNTGTSTNNAKSPIRGPSGIQTFIPECSRIQEITGNLREPQTNSETYVTSAFPTANSSPKSLPPVCEDNPISNDSFSNIIDIPTETLQNNVPGLFEQNSPECVLFDIEGVDSLLENVSPPPIKVLPPPGNTVCPAVDDSRRQDSSSREKVAKTVQSPLVPSNNTVNSQVQASVLSQKLKPQKSCPISNNSDKLHNLYQTASNKTMKHSQTSLTNDPLAPRKRVKVLKPYSLLENISPPPIEVLSPPGNTVCPAVDDSRRQDSSSREKVAKTVQSPLVPSNNTVNSQVQASVLSQKLEPQKSCPISNNSDKLHNLYQTASNKTMKHSQTSLTNDPLAPSKRVTVLKPYQTSYQTEDAKNIMSKKKPIMISEHSSKRSTTKKITSTNRSTARFARTFPCHLCKTRQEFNLREMAKCMVCSNWICFSCSGTTMFDYICSVCLGVE